MGLRKCGRCGGSYQSGSRLGSGPVSSGPKCNCPPGKRPIIGMGSSRNSAVGSPPLRSLTQKTNSQNSPVLSIAEQLSLLAQLHESGALTDEEFAALKSQLITGRNS